MAQTAQGQLKHAPFCKPNCAYIHHPILLAIFNFSDADVKESIRVIDAEIHKLEKVTMPNGTKWLKHMDIPDPSVNFQYSALHWACAFGYTELVQWLISQGIPSRVQHKNSGQTPLHRAVVCLQKACGRSAVARLQVMLPSLYQALQVGDGEGNTPLHLASSMLHLGRPTPAFYQDCISIFLSYAKKMGEDFLKEVVNKKNRDGDTCCHILAMQDRNLNSLKTLVEHQADLDLQNVEGVTALNVAQELGQMKNSVYLKNAAKSSSDDTPSPKENTPKEKTPANPKSKNIKVSPVVKIVDNARAMLNGSPEKGAAGTKRAAAAATASPTRNAKVARNASSHLAASSSSDLSSLSATTSAAPTSRRAAAASKAAAAKVVTPSLSRVSVPVTPLQGQAVTPVPSSAAASSSQSFPKPAQVSTVVMKTRNALAQQNARAASVVKVVSSASLPQTPEHGASSGQAGPSPQVRVVPVVACPKSGGPAATAQMRKLVLMLNSHKENSGSSAEANAKQDGRTGDVGMSEATSAPGTSTPEDGRVPNGAGPEAHSADHSVDDSVRNLSPALSRANSESSINSATQNNTPLAIYLKACSPDVRRTLLENIRKDENTSKEKLENLRKDVEASRQRRDEVRGQLVAKQSRMQELLDEVLELESAMHALEAEQARLDRELEQGQSRLAQEERWVGTVALASQDLSHLFQS